MSKVSAILTAIPLAALTSISAASACTLAQTPLAGKLEAVETAPEAYRWLLRAWQGNTWGKSDLCTAVQFIKVTEDGTATFLYSYTGGPPAPERFEVKMPADRTKTSEPVDIGFGRKLRFTTWEKDGKLLLYGYIHHHGKVEGSWHDAGVVTAQSK